LDNLTHTLVGACLAEAGLKKRTALGAATLMIGANFPDIDVVAVPLGMGIEWRRGVTHGFLALAILPFVLGWIMLQWDRRVRARRQPGLPRADFRHLVILSAISILTHPTLDFMNTYGMRWLMPFVDRWFYADGLFIVDIWLLLALLLGALVSRRRRVPTPARIALVGLALYTTGMLVVTGMGRRDVSQAFPGRKIMVAPVPVVPWQRDVLIEDGDTYLSSSWSLFGGLGQDRSGRPRYLGSTRADEPALAAAKSHPRVRGFLRWARFPVYDVVRDASGAQVRVSDARYFGDWATVQVTLP